VKPLTELTNAVVSALARLHGEAIVAHRLAAIGAPIEQVRESVALLDLTALAEAVTALEIDLDVQQPITIEAVPELSKLLNAPVPEDSLSSPRVQSVLAALPDFEHGALAPDDVHAAHPVEPSRVLGQCDVCKFAPPHANDVTCLSGARCPQVSEYAVPLGEVEDEIESASRATGIPVPKAVRS
jgi:hypothetical protein